MEATPAAAAALNLHYCTTRVVGGAASILAVHLPESTAVRLGVMGGPHGGGRMRMTRMACRCGGLPTVLRLLCLPVQERRGELLTALSFLFYCSALCRPAKSAMDGWMLFVWFCTDPTLPCCTGCFASSSCILNEHELADQVERFEPNMAVRIEMVHVFVFQICEHEYEY